MSAWGQLRGWCLLRIARPQPGQAFVPQIDGLRFVAILAVLLYHMQGFVEANGDMQGIRARDALHTLMSTGYFGVPLFFAISGYIIARPFLGEQGVSLRRYFVRRLTRLEPPYFINLLLIFVLKVWFLNAAFPELLPHLLASLVYAHGPIYGTHSEVNGVAWSLEIEWQFYLLAPFALAALTRATGALRHCLLAAAILLGGWAFQMASEVSPRVSLSLLCYFGFFLAGVWVALLDHEGRFKQVRGATFDAIALLASFLILAVLLAGKGAPPLLPLLTFLLVIGSLRGRWVGRFLGWWPIHCVGAMCYTIYLYHFFVISALGRTVLTVLPSSLPESAVLPVFALAVVPLTLVACALPYLLIERPFMVWRPGQTRLRDAFRYFGSPTAASSSSSGRS